MERRLIAEFETEVARLCADLAPHNIGISTEIVALPQDVRGFGPVKLAAVQRTAERRAALWSARAETHAAPRQAAE
jgi:indolepyruvate ferredoxin oxidoreductase